MQTKGIYTPPETENTNTHLIFTNCEHAFIDIRCKIQTKNAYIMRMISWGLMMCHSFIVETK